MHEPDFWTHCGEAMEHTMEGNRLIATELGHAARRVWRHMLGKLDSALRTLGSQEHLPPV